MSNDSSDDSSDIRSHEKSNTNSNKIDELQKPSSFFTLIKTVIKEFVRKNAGNVALYAVLLLCGTLISVVGITKTFAKLYKVVSEGDQSSSYKLLFLIIGLSLALLVINFFIDRTEGWLGPSFQRFVKTKLLKQVFQNNEEQFLDNILPIKYRAFISASSSASHYLFQVFMKTYLPNAILLVILAAFLFSLSVEYGIIFSIITVLSILLFAVNKEWLLKLSTNAEKVSRQSDGFAFDVLQSLKTVISKNTSDTELNEINQKFFKTQNKLIEMNHMTDYISYGINLVVAIGIFIIMYIAIKKLGTGVAPVAVLTALSLMATLRSKLVGFSATNIQAIGEYARGNANNLEELKPSNQTPNQTNQTNQKIFKLKKAPLLLRQTNDKIEFRNVSFSYANDNKPVIQNFSWKLQPNKINVLRANSGRGKSTLAKLLLRLYEIDSGEIIMNRVNIEDIPHKQLRQKLCFINQDMQMLNRTIKEVIMYGNTNEKLSEMHKLWQSVKPYFKKQTLSSSVGRNGNNLSSGQKQSLRIINAMLSDADVLILDEPCSGLNEELKNWVKERILNAKKNKTIWLITHNDELASALADHIKYI